MAPGQVPAVVPEVAPPVVVAPASPPEDVEGGPPPVVGVDPPEPAVTTQPRSRPKKDPPPRTRDTSGPGGVVAPTTVPLEAPDAAPGSPVHATNAASTASVELLKRLTI